MDNLIIIVLAVTAFIFIILYFSLRRGIFSIISQLEKINSIKTNSKVRISAGDKKLTRLILEINKTLEEKLKTEAEYKRMDLELRQAIANISHDLRTPLTSILGYVQLIEDDSLSEEEKKQYIEIVKKRSVSLQNLISGFYDLSRLEAKEYKFCCRALRVSDILSDVMASFYKDFLDKNIEPSVSIDDRDLPVLADEGAVRRVFSNLIQNILNYGKQFTSITLKQQDGYVAAVFENDAPGLSEEDTTHIFERFFTADRTRNGKGTGLGLAITKQLVEQMGHSITARLKGGNLSIEIRWKNQ